MSPSTFRYWSHGYRRTFPNRPAVVMGPVISAVPDGRSRRVPFVGLVEATVVQAFRSTGLSLQKIRQALEVLTHQGELRNALASQQLYTDGAEILYDYANDHEEPLLRLLTVVGTGQRVFHEVLDEYLQRSALVRGEVESQGRGTDQVDRTRLRRPDGGHFGSPRCHLAGSGSSLRYHCRPSSWTGE